MSLEKQTAIITGGAGFIGSHIADALLERGYQVVIIDNLSTGQRENLPNGAIFVEADITTMDFATTLEQYRPSVIFHLAAQLDVRKSVTDPAADAEQNIIATIRLLEACKKYPGTKIVFSSSGGAIYGDTTVVPTPDGHPEQPASPYGIAKLAIEKYLFFYYQVYGIPFVALRYANVYGPRQNNKGEAGVVAIFTNRFLRNQAPTIFGDGTQTRDFVFVGDVVAANMAALTSEYVGACNIATGTETSINQLTDLLKNLTGSSATIEYAPAKAGEQLRSCLECSLARTALSWQPKYDLHTGLQQTIDWFRSQSL